MSAALTAWHRQNAENTKWGRGYNPRSALPQKIPAANTPVHGSTAAAECLMPVKLTGGSAAQLG